MVDEIKFASLGEIRKTNGKGAEFICRTMIQKCTFNAWVGFPESYKSYEAVRLGCAMAMGADWNTLKIEKGKVLFLDNEDCEGSFRDRVEAYFKGSNFSKEEIENAEKNLFYLNPNMSITDSEGNPTKFYQLLKKALDENPVDLIIMDSFKAFSEHKENDSDGTGRAISVLKKLCQEKNTTILSIHHNAKSADALDSDGRGSGDFLAKARSKTNFVHIPRENCYFIVHKKCNNGARLPPIKIKYEWEIESDEPDLLKRINLAKNVDAKVKFTFSGIATEAEIREAMKGTRTEKKEKTFEKLAKQIQEEFNEIGKEYKKSEISKFLGRKSTDASVQNALEYLQSEGIINPAEKHGYWKRIK
jgi:RecA-family ATPase